MATNHQRTYASQYQSFVSPIRHRGLNLFMKVTAILTVLVMVMLISESEIVRAQTPDGEDIRTGGAGGATDSGTVPHGFRESDRLEGVGDSSTGTAESTGSSGGGHGVSSPAQIANHNDTQRPKISVDVFAVAESEGRVAVIVELSSPSPLTVASLDSTGLLERVAQAQSTVLDNLSDSDFVPTYQYRALPSIAGIVTESGLQRLLIDPNVASVILDGDVHGSLTESVPFIGADNVHALGFTGEGITVAVIDTGIDTDHADLSDDLVYEKCYLSISFVPLVGYCHNGWNDDSGPGSAEDDHGHGTHVSGIITSPNGVAPDAKIVSYKVLRSDGTGKFSDMQKALDDIIADASTEVDCINMSIGNDAEYQGGCDQLVPSMTTAILTLRARGILTFIASGNEFHKSGVAFPACISAAVSVGNVQDTYPFAVVAKSNSDTTLDLLAPGRWITASRMGGGQTTFTGTSMASPHAAGAAALLREARPGLSVGDIESLLKETGVPTTDTNGVVKPRINVWSAIHSELPPDDVRILSPTGGGPFAGLINVQASASDPNGVQFVEFQYSTDHTSWGFLPSPDDDPSNNDGVDYWEPDGWALRFDTTEAGISTDNSVWVRIRATDDYGIRSSWVKSSSFAVDNSISTPTSISISGVALSSSSVTPGDTVRVSGNATYNTGWPVFPGTATISISGHGTWTAPLDSNGNFSREITAPISPGSYTVNLNVSDGSLSSNASAILTVQSTGGSQNNYKFDSAVTTRDMQTSDPFDPVGATQFFRSDDLRVLTWVRLNDVYEQNRSQPVTVRWEYGSVAKFDLRSFGV